MYLISEASPPNNNKAENEIPIIPYLKYSTILFLLHELSSIFSSKSQTY